MARPKLVTAAAEDEVYSFDHYAEQAAAATKPFRLKLPVFETVTDTETGGERQDRRGDEVVEIPAPSTEAMRQVAVAQRAQDVDILADAIFGVYAERILDLTRDKDYLIINAMVRDVMAHYGRRLEDLGES